MKQHDRGWYGSVHQYDPAPGSAPTPGSQGAHIFPIGSDVPMLLQQHGKLFLPVTH